MNILVTGGLGFIGHNVVQRLERLGHQVIITDTQTNYGILNQAELDYLFAERRKKITTDRIYKIDIADQSGIDWLFKKHTIDTVIHLASFPRQKVVNADPQLGSRAMSEGLLNLLEAGKNNNISKFVYISSSMVYGDFANNIKEDAECDPIGQYGIMKLAGEWLVKDYSKRGYFNHVIIRPSAVYGELDVEDRVVSKFLLAAIRGETLKVNGANESLDFTYVNDAADGIVSATLSENTANKIYNVTKGRSRTLLEAALLATTIAGQGTVEEQARDLNFPSRGALNIEAARRDFNYFPQVDVEEGFQAYYEWINNSLYWAKKAV